MRILHLLPPLTKGGAERVAVSLANRAVEDGCKVAIVASRPTDPELLLQSVRPEIPVRYVSSRETSRLAPYVALLPWLCREKSWLLSFDIVHCHLTFGEVTGSAIAALRDLSGRDRPKIVESYQSAGMPIARWRRTLAARLATGRDAFALLAEDDYWTRFRSAQPNLRTAIIPNGVATPRTPARDEVHAYRTSLGLREGSGAIVGTIGRIVPDRMPLKTLGIFTGVSRRLPQTEFLFGGYGPALQEVRDAAAAAGIADRLHLPGMVLDPAVPLALMDVYVGINVGPIAGIAGLEAIAAGVPTVALQARADYEGGENDWIWSSADPDAVAAEAARLIEDPAERAQLARRQRKELDRRYSVEAMWRSYAQLYADCLAA